MKRHSPLPPGNETSRRMDPPCPRRRAAPTPRRTTGPRSAAPRTRRAPQRKQPLMTRRMSCSMTIPAGSWVAGIGALTPSTNHQAIGATPGGDRKEKRWNTPDPSAAEALASTAPASGSALNAQHVSWNHERRTGGSDTNTPLGMTRIASRPPLRTCSAPPTSTRDPGGDRSTDLVVDQPDGDRALRGGDLKRTDRRCNRDA